jgi:integrase
MASIHKDPCGRSPYWYCAYTLADGRRAFRSTKQTERKKALEFCLKLDKAAAAARAGELTEIQARKILDDILESTGSDKLGVETARAFFSKWITSKELSTKPSTALHYKKTVRKFLEFLDGRADKSVAAISVRDIEGFRDSLAQSGISNPTLKGDLKIVRRVLASAQRQALIVHNPALAVDMPLARSQEREVFSPDEVRALLEVASQEWKTAILCGYYLGARLGDVVALSWDSVDLAGRVVFYLQAKTDKRVEVPLHPDLEAHLMSMANDSPHRALCPMLSQARIDGRKGLSNQFAHLLECAGLDRRVVQSSRNRKFARRSFHSLRHSFASYLANAGVNSDLRMKLIGHSTLAVHARYSHLELKPLRAAIAKLPRLTEKAKE